MKHYFIFVLHGKDLQRDTSKIFAYAQPWIRTKGYNITNHIFGNSLSTGVIKVRVLRRVSITKIPSIWFPSFSSLGISILILHIKSQWPLLDTNTRGLMK